MWAGTLGTFSSSLLSTSSPAFGFSLLIIVRSYEFINNDHQCFQLDLIIRYAMWSSLFPVFSLCRKHRKKSPGTNKKCELNTGWNDRQPDAVRLHARWPGHRVDEGIVGVWIQVAGNFLPEREERDEKDIWGRIELHWFVWLCDIFFLDPHDITRYSVILYSNHTILAIFHDSWSVQNLSKNIVQNAWYAWLIHILVHVECIKCIKVGRNMPIHAKGMSLQMQRDKWS